jgi:hemoglobin
MSIDPQDLSFLYSEIGKDRLTAMVAAFYRRVPTDDLLGPMYPADDLEGAEQRLRDFLVMRLGGPDTYTPQRGHPRLRMRHGPFSIGEAERDRWLALMSEAMTEVGVPDNTRARLEPFFYQVADFMRNR